MATPEQPSTPLRPSFVGELPPGWDITSDGGMLAFATSSEPGMTIELLPNRSVMAETCELGPEPGVATNAQAIVAALAARPGLIAGDSSPASVGGLSGLQVDLRGNREIAGSCDDGAFVPLVGFMGAMGWEFTGIGTKDRLRLVVLDAPGGQNFVIHLWATNAEAFDQHIESASAILSQVSFEA
jgi:hypothetical protein